MALSVEGRVALGLKFIPFPAPPPGRTICLAWRRASVRAAELRLLGEQLVHGVPMTRRLLGPRRAGS